MNVRQDAMLTGGVGNIAVGNPCVCMVSHGFSSCSDQTLLAQSIALLEQWGSLRL
jgi:hypothetical protein